MAYGRIDYDIHARENMVKRRISARQVLTTLNRPDRVVPTHSDRLIAERRTEAGNTIRVVYVEQHGGTTAYVITVYRVGGGTP
jgi:prolyl oligopeptidase PreP (S9A serine peptidase family)